MKVRSIVHKGLRRLYEDNSSKGVCADTVDKLRKMLAFFDAMQSPEQLRALPTWKAHMLTGDRKGTWSLHVTRNRRRPSRSRTTRLSTSTSRTTTERETTMAMLAPVHPGDFIRTEIIEAHGLSVSAAAKALGVSRPALSNLLNQKADLSGEMALRIEKAFGVNMDTLMRMQGAYDIAQARKDAGKIRVRRYQSDAAHA